MWYVLKLFGRAPGGREGGTCEVKQFWLNDFYWFEGKTLCQGHAWQRWLQEREDVAMTLDFVDEIYTCIVIILWKRGMIQCASVLCVLLKRWQSWKGIVVPGRILPARLCREKRSHSTSKRTSSLTLYWILLKHACTHFAVPFCPKASKLKLSYGLDFPSLIFTAELSSKAAESHCGILSVVTQSCCFPCRM